MAWVLVKAGVNARNAVRPDEDARYDSRSDAEIAAKHAHSKGWEVKEVPDGDGA